MNHLFNITDRNTFKFIFYLCGNLLLVTNYFNTNDCYLDNVVLGDSRI